jgi:hypothetical protein
VGVDVGVGVGLGIIRVGPFGVVVGVGLGVGVNSGVGETLGVGVGDELWAKEFPVGKKKPATARNRRQDSAIMINKSGVLSP